MSRAWWAVIRHARNAGLVPAKKRHPSSPANERECAASSLPCARVKTGEGGRRDVRRRGSALPGKYGHRLAYTPAHRPAPQNIAGDRLTEADFDEVIFAYSANDWDSDWGISVLLSSPAAGGGHACGALDPLPPRPAMMFGRWLELRDFATNAFELVVAHLYRCSLEVVDAFAACRLSALVWESSVGEVGHNAKDTYYAEDRSYVMLRRVVQADDSEMIDIAIDGASEEIRAQSSHRRQVAVQDVMYASVGRRHLGTERVRWLGLAQLPLLCDRT
ncbi:uncharacterized protein B0H18DRAFT_954921 [Fomitopsis serialis]|uniref:uncharacterized protein n=1 Tax=Fomitopsis serialis TaxID=139415 RepID=UPI0020075AF5|nr:uncharacterized protein B0H18DRAFT_954921 [Neoantrodia serialis]KAH9926049.1 hypothetical protein B0H18DRAFT_954921 [Neoantrodia serialis]